jgi:endonuclease-3 related protein
MKPRSSAPMTILPKSLYKILLDTYGPQNWWPVDTVYHQKQKSDPRFEIIVGAILTQNTAWNNVKKALENLKKHKTLTIQTIAQINEKDLKIMIQPSGFFNQKAKRLKLFSSYLHQKYHDDLNTFFTRDTADIRRELLSRSGIGPETADSILLYAANHPVFVVDAYTKRICHRLPYQVSHESYELIQYFFDTILRSSIPKKELVSTYKEFHALFVALAKKNCWKKNPLCDTCPLTTLCKKLL